MDETAAGGRDEYGDADVGGRDDAAGGRDDKGATDANGRDGVGMGRTEAGGAELRFGAVSAKGVEFGAGERDWRANAAAPR